MELSIQQLRVIIQRDIILKNLNLNVKSGEFVSLLGKSGCGKTTLLKSIAGLIETETGTITFDGNNVEKLPPEKRGAVIVFQDLRLFPHLTVEQNISFALDVRKVPHKEQREIVSSLLREVQLPGFEKRKIQEMSGGQRQRVALARALAAMPKVLLLDEPFSGLDENLRFEMGRLVRKIQKDHNITTIMVTHDKEEALKMSDRIVLMDAGEILQDDTPNRIFDKPANRRVADYFGMVNYLPGEVTNGVFTCDYGQWPVDATPDGCYEVVARPTALEVASDGARGHEMSVVGQVFMGENTLLQLEANGVYVTVQILSMDAQSKGIKEGQRVRVWLKDSSYHLLEVR